MFRACLMISKLNIYEVSIMFHQLKTIRDFINDESGLTVVEYVVGAGLIVIGFAGLFIVFRDILTANFATLF